MTPLGPSLQQQDGPKAADGMFVGNVSVTWDKTDLLMQPQGLQNKAIFSCTTADSHKIPFLTSENGISEYDADFCARTQAT